MEVEEKIITNVYAFTNGMTMVFDQNGEQMPAFQGWTEEMVPKIREAGFTGEIQHTHWDAERVKNWAVTVAAMEAARRGDTQSFASIEEMMADLHSDDEGTDDAGK